MCKYYHHLDKASYMFSELMGLLQKQHLLENQFEHANGYSDAETISQTDDSQYWSINDYAIS